MILFRIIVAVLFVSIYFSQTSRPRISKAEDLPRFSYAVTASTAELLTSDSAYNLLSRPLRADVDKLLRDYEISDKATLIHLLSCRYELEANAGDYGSALRDLLQARDLQEKPGQKLVWRIDDETAIRARSKGQSNDKAWQQAFHEEFRDRVAALPWGTVETDIKDMKAAYQLSAPKVVVSQLTANFDPIIQNNHAINFDHACRIVDNRNWMNFALRLRTDVIEILGSYVAANRRPQPDIWVSREFDLTDRDLARPVGIGIWDGGVDLSVFPRQLAARPKGPAYDFDDNPSSDLLLPLDPDLRQHLPEVTMYTRGRHDIAESIDSPEAAALSR